MNFNGYDNFQDFMNNFGFNTNQNMNANPPGDPHGVGDIPGGFQDLDPMAFATIGEIIGNIMAGNLPFNVQNAVANWLMLIGQAMVTFNAQQQYFQTGPGRYYDIRNKNVTNPFTTSESTVTDSGEVSDQGGDVGLKSNNYDKEINNLKKCVCELTNQVNMLQKEINKLKYK